MAKMGVGILGATGIVGQRYVSLLADHPWFEVRVVSASQASVGKKYREAAKWFIEPPMPEDIGELVVTPPDPQLFKREGVELVFSALPSEVAKQVEEDFAAAGFAIASDASAHRYDPDVPILIPEVNPSHLQIIEYQRRNRGWSGFIVTGPNCTTIGLVMTLKPLLDAFGIKRVLVATMQALSGAGYFGVPSMAILDNLIPYIKKEEEKVSSEPQKILGRFENGKILPANVPIGASCHRVNVLDGHTEAVFVELGRKAFPEEVAKVFKEFQPEPQQLKLPTAPQPPIIVREEPDRPQPRFDRYAGEPPRAKGMAVVVGRIREEPVFETGIKYMLLSHNTIRGAAGNSVLTAELLKAKGWL